MERVANAQCAPCLVEERPRSSPLLLYAHTSADVIDFDIWRRRWRPLQVIAEASTTPCASRDGIESDDDPMLVEGLTVAITYTQAGETVTFEVTEEVDAVAALAGSAAALPEERISELRELVYLPEGSSMVRATVRVPRSPLKTVCREDRNISPCCAMAASQPHSAQHAVAMQDYICGILVFHLAECLAAMLSTIICVPSSCVDAFGQAETVKAIKQNATKAARARAREQTKLDAEKEKEAELRLEIAELRSELMELRGATSSSNSAASAVAASTAGLLGAAALVPAAAS